MSVPIQLHRNKMCNVSNYSCHGNVTIHSIRTVVDVNVTSKNIHMCTVAIETLYCVPFCTAVEQLFNFKLLSTILDLHVTRLRF